MERCIREIRKNWEEFGRKDPLWSILPIPEKKDNRWNINDLYQTGREEIDSVINYINNLNLEIRFYRALDFGCGVGRLTQALCVYFEECIGVDISFSMLNIASKYNNHRGKCT
ncbi:MAG: methyltransferase domain-containing protein, partial [candidate division WOR-3 bacterium]